MISTETVANPDWRASIHELQKLTSSPDEIVGLNKAIHETLPPKVRSKVEPEEIWISYPDLPTLKELDLAYVARSNGEIVHAQEIIPTRGWVGAYETYKSKGHVFAPREYLATVYAAAQSVLRQRCGLEFNEAVVRAVCHWD